MISKTSNPFSGQVSEATDSFISAGIQDQLRRGRTSPQPSPQGGEGEDQVAAAEHAVQDADNGGSVNSADAPSGPTTEEGEVVTPQDTKLIDGEGNMSSPASDVDSLEGGDTPGAADGGDSGGSAVGMDMATDIRPDSPAGTQDPLTTEVSSITPPDADTTLRAPSLASPEIGGRQTDGEESAI